MFVIYRERERERPRNMRHVIMYVQVLRRMCIALSLPIHQPSIDLNHFDVCMCACADVLSKATTFQTYDWLMTSSISIQQRVR